MHVVRNSVIIARCIVGMCYIAACVHAHTFVWVGCVCRYLKPLIKIRVVERWTWRPQQKYILIIAFDIRHIRKQPIIIDTNKMTLACAVRFSTRNFMFWTWSKKKQKSRKTKKHFPKWSPFPFDVVVVCIHHSMYAIHWLCNRINLSVITDNFHIDIE